MIELTPTRALVEAVCVNLGDRQAAELAACGYDLAQLPAQIAHVGPRLHRLTVLATATRLGALIGISEEAPGRGRLLFLQTREFPRMMFAARRWWWRRYVPAVIAPRFRRLDMIGIEDRQSNRFRETFGFTREGPAPSYGVNGEDFSHWAFLPGVDAASAAIG